MAKKQQKKKQAKDNTSVLAIAAAGGIGLLVGLFALGRQGREGDAGAAGTADRTLGLPSEAAGDGGSAGVQIERAPEAFRPDPTAPINPDKRDAFAPATMPNPNAAQPAM